MSNIYLRSISPRGDYSVHLRNDHGMKIGTLRVINNYLQAYTNDDQCVGFYNSYGEGMLAIASFFEKTNKQ